MIKVFKILAGIFMVAIMVLAIAWFWPVPEIPVPRKFEKIVIKSVHVVDVETGRILKHRNVWIEGSRISSIDSMRTIDPEPGVLVIEGKSRFLIPGLWDMHTHSTQLSPWLHHPLYIAHGVTGIRDMSGQMGQYDSYWAGTADRKIWNERLASYQQVTPRYVLQSSYQINGARSVPEDFPEFFRAQSTRDAVSLLDYYQREGANFIKVYSEIPAEAFRTLARESSRYNLHLAGHKPLNIMLEEAIQSGQRSFEHGRVFLFDCFPAADSLLQADNKVASFYRWKNSMVHEFDTIRAEQLMELMSEKDAHWVPTLQTIKMSAYANDEDFVDSPYLEYIPTLRKMLFWKPDLSRSAKANTTGEQRDLNKTLYELTKTQIKKANSLGVPIMAGTDVTDTYVFPGISLHTELEDLTSSGLTNLEALQSATLIPARYCNQEKDHGSIEVGKLADLVLLNRNPLKDITSTQEIAGVILHGYYYDPAKLEELTESTRDLASSFHMNVKFAFSVLGSPLMRIQLAD